MEPKYMLVVKQPRGLKVRDRPAPQSMGAVEMRAEPVGKALMCYDKINIQGVDYGRLVPQNPLRPEWVRIAEADHSIEYVEVIELETPQESGRDIANAINRLAAAVERLAAKYPLSE